MADFDNSGFEACTGNKERSSGASTATNGQHGFDNLTTACGTTGSSGIGGSESSSGKNGGCGGGTEPLFLDFGSSKVSPANEGVGWMNLDADPMVWAYTGGGNLANAAAAILGATSAAGSTTRSEITAATLESWTLVSSLDMGANSTPGTALAVTGDRLFSGHFLTTTYVGAATRTLNAGAVAFKLNSFTVGLCAGTLSGGTGGNGQACGTNLNQNGGPKPGLPALAGLALVGDFFVSRHRQA